MKKHLKYSLLITIISYLIVSFVSWDLLCILKIPKLHPRYRAFLAMFFVIKEVVIYFILEDNGKNKKVIHELLISTSPAKIK